MQGLLYPRKVNKMAYESLVKSRVYYGWVIVGVAFVTLGIAFGVWYSFSVFFWP